MTPTKDLMLSSPDPLGMSNSNISNHSPTKKGRHASITPRKALAEATGNPQVQEFYINTPPNPARNASPRKSRRQTTRPTSPWRIRLTVQAEPVHEIQRLEKSPVKRLTEQTTTITVPLKGGDDTPPAMEKKGRGRPRKSLDGPVKRSSTPKPKAGGGRRRTMSDTPKKQEVDARSETATPPKKPKGRPKKSVEPKDTKSISGLSRENDLDLWLGSSVVDGEETVKTRSKTSRTRSRGRRQEITPIKIAVDSDMESQPNLSETAGDDTKELARTFGKRDDEGDHVHQNLSEPNEAPTPHMQETLLSELACEPSILGQQDEKGWRSTNPQENYTPSPHDYDAQDRTEFDPTVPYHQCDSILESEGFSMVSVSSLTSGDNNSVSHPEQHRTLQERTPTTTSSLSVPPAPELSKVQSSPRRLENSSDGTPKLAKIVRAGIALQGVLSPKDRSQKLGSPFQESRKPSSFLTVDEPPPQREVSRPVLKDDSPEERPSDLFRGFGAGTRRELRAGLRLGEELAKRQHQSSQKSAVGLKEADDVFQSNGRFDYPRLPALDADEGYSLKPPRSEKQIRYPLISNNQLPSPERSLVDDDEDRMSWKVDTPIKQEEPSLTSVPILVSDQSIEPNASVIDYTMIARKEEWQREREAVSKQIEMANKSQVIIIDSDNEEEESEEDVVESDVWQAEAQSADPSIRTTPEASDNLLQPEMVKPRRSKIPSPWRRNSHVSYSDDAVLTESDLFWQPDLSQGGVSKRRNARKVQAQEHSNISAESDFDISLDKIRKAEAQIQLETTKAWPAWESNLSKDEDRSTLKSAGQTLYDGDTQHAELTTDTSFIVLPSENQVLTALPPGPNVSSMRDVIEVSKRITEDTPAETIYQSSEDNKVAIDPRILQKSLPSKDSDQPIPTVRPIRPLQPSQSSSSWLSRITAPIWSVFAQVASLPPAATREDILCSSPHEPLCQLTPWEECHFRALGPLYYGSLLYGAHLFPFNPHSRSARYCGTYATTKFGWSRKITPEDCGITDAFMVLLDERGFALGEPGARWIDEATVIAKCVALWVGMVKRGEIEVDSSKGEKVGLRDQGDKKWTKDDIDWAGNQSAYFERKRREFDGLPSWKNKA